VTRRARWILVLAAIGAFTAACTSSPDDLGVPVTVPSTTTPPPPVAGGVAWGPCPAHNGWQCGDLSVPLNHADPGGPTISIALNRHPAEDPADRIGSLLINPGGPGASGVQFAYDAVDGLLDQVLLDDFDIIGFDPRGVGSSTAISCVDGPALDALNHLPPDPTTPVQIDQVIAGVKSLDAGCEAHSATLLPYVSTKDAAEDIDDIRAAVGDSKLTYLGFSYGTLLGATYASLFPTHIRAMVLDGAIDPAVDAAAESVDQAVGFQHDLSDFLAWCTDQGGSCPFQAGGAANLGDALTDLMASIAAHPLPGGNGRTLGPGEAFNGVLAPLYDDEEWPDLASALAAAQGGDGSQLMAQNDAYLDRSPNGTYDNEEVANVAISCADDPPLTLAQIEALAVSAAKQAPFFGGPVAWSLLSCTYWPVAATGRPGPLHAPGAPPLLVVGSTGDPATPYAWAQALASELPGVLVTRHGDGHAAYPYSACVRAIADRYLTTLAVPTAASADCQS
jgi:pimeloyl-ACP methyl ester carboxylesterase